MASRAQKTAKRDMDKMREKYGADVVDQGFHEVGAAEATRGEEQRHQDHEHQHAPVRPGVGEHAPHQRPDGPVLGRDAPSLGRLTQAASSGGSIGAYRGGLR